MLDQIKENKTSFIKDVNYTQQNFFYPDQKPEQKINRVSSIPVLRSQFIPNRPLPTKTKIEYPRKCSAQQSIYSQISPKQSTSRFEYIPYKKKIV